MSNLIVIVGNSFPIKNTLKTKGFRFDGASRLWFKPETDLANFKALSQELESENVLVAFSSSLESTNALIKARRESRQPALVEHFLTNKVVEMTKWYATKFQEQHETKFAFRNLKILKVKVETERAFLVDVEFFGGISNSCGCCGKRLTDRFSVATGIGPICAERLGIPRITDLEQAHLVIEQMGRICREAGVFKEVWIPKSQIRGTERQESERQTA